MENISDLMKSRAPKEQPQVELLKKYLLEHYQITTTVRTSTRHYLIHAPNGALAHKLRVDTETIIEACQLDKRLLIHIRQG